MIRIQRFTALAIIVLFTQLHLLLAPSAQAGDPSGKTIASIEGISSEIQSLKKEVISLNGELRLIEEELLFPSNTRYSVFVSLDIGKYFTLEAVKLKVDGKLVSSHVYSPRQRQAMAKGGIQKLYETNLSEGMHTITAFFTGIGPDGRPYKRASSLDFNKAGSSKYAELVVVDNDANQEPDFKINQW